MTRFYKREVSAIWTPELDAKLAEVYVAHGKVAAMKALGLREGQVRSRAATLKLKARGVSDISIKTQKENGLRRRGIKRPEHAALMRQMKAEGRILNLTPEAHKEIGKKAKERIARKGHPRGALGMKHTEETKQVLSRKSKESWSKKTQDEVAERSYKAAKTREANGTPLQQRTGTTWKSGWREFGGRRIFYRSRWEANYGRYLEWLKCRGDIKEWEHEPKTFWFEGIKRGCVSYLPDFCVTDNNGNESYHEVKGWMDARSKTKISRMGRYHPEVVLIVIAKKQYKELEGKVSSLIDGWEADK